MGKERFYGLKIMYMSKVKSVNYELRKKDKLVSIFAKGWTEPCKLIQIFSVCYGIDKVLERIRIAEHIMHLSFVTTLLTLIYRE